MVIYGELKVVDITERINELTDEKCRKFTQNFLKFYLESGFGSKLKSDIDGEVFSLMCDYKIIEDTISPISLGLELKTTSASINKLREYRFYHKKMSKEQLKAAALKVLSNNLETINKDNTLSFSVHNISVRYYLENLMQSNDKTYDTNANGSNIKIGIKTFWDVYVLCGGSLEKVKANLDKDTSYKNLWKKIKKEFPNNLPEMLNGFMKVVVEETGRKGVETFFALLGN